MQLFNSSQQSLKTTMGVVLFVSFAVGFLCVSLVHLIPTYVDMGMGSMHTMHHTSQPMTFSGCCDAQTTDHMDVWKGTLVGIPQGFTDLLGLIVFATAATLFVFSDVFATRRLVANVLFLRYRHYTRAHPDFRTYDALCLAFARGILHPKKTF